MTPQQFIKKWKPVALTERATAHEHFIDLCRMLSHPTPVEADHHSLYQVRDALALGERLVLRAEPDNPYDANAVAVHRADGPMLGYIPRVANEPVTRLLAEGARVDAEVVEQLHVRNGEKAPDDLAFTLFLNGDPRIRLTLRRRVAGDPPS